MQAWLKPVRFRNDGEQSSERRATWLELFFDLVFVVAVAQLAHVLHDDLSAPGALRFLMLFVPVWWAWMSYTYYADQFDNDDLLFRLATFASMFFVAAMATFIHAGMADYGSGFALSYVGLRLIIVLLYARARLSAKTNHVFLNRFIGGNVLGMVFWLSSIAVDSPARYALWGIAMAVEMATPILALRGHGRGPVASASHIPERIGLFTIIVLGETVVAVADGVGAIEWDVRSVTTALTGLALAAGIWWLYFPRLEGTAITRHLFWAFAYPYAHLAIFLAVVATGVGVEIAIDHARDSHLTTQVRVALGGSMALALAAISIAQLGTTRSLGTRELSTRAAGVAGSLLLIPLLASAGAQWFTGALALVLAAVVLLESPGTNESGVHAPAHG